MQRVAELSCEIILHFYWGLHQDCGKKPFKSTSPHLAPAGLPSLLAYFPLFYFSYIQGYS